MKLQFSEKQSRDTVYFFRISGKRGCRRIHEIMAYRDVLECCFLTVCNVHFTESAWLSNMFIYFCAIRLLVTSAIPQ